MRGGVSAVAAMQFEITDGAAVEFCRGFYNAIAHGRGVDEAVGSGRVAILGSSGETLEWVTPVLYLRGLDSQLFAVEGAAVGTAPAVPSTQERLAKAQDAALNQHDPATAIPVLDTVLADVPRNAPAQESDPLVHLPEPTPVPAQSPALTPHDDVEAELRSAPTINVDAPTVPADKSVRGSGGRYPLDLGEAR